MKVKIIENSSNRKAIYYREVKTKSSKFKGVYLKKGAKKKKWAVKISLNGKLFHIESFELETDAAVCYDMAAIMIIGTHAWKNQSSCRKLKRIMLPPTVFEKVLNRINEIKQMYLESKKIK